jgi:SAM-dependent methyltransferase
MTSLLHRLGLRFVGRKLRELGLEIRIWFAHLGGRWRARRYRDARGLKVQFGCGPKAKPGWLNVDLFGNPDLRLDLRKPLPLPDGLASFVYSEHFLEHLDYPLTVQQFLRECWRLLEPGGRIRIGVPDAEGPLAYYVQTRKSPPARITSWSGHPDWPRTTLDQIDFLLRMNHGEHLDEHRHGWDFETLSFRLREAGFGDIARSDYEVELDSEDRRAGTLYVEALK